MKILLDSTARPVPSKRECLKVMANTPIMAYRTGSPNNVFTRTDQEWFFIADDTGHLFEITHKNGECDRWWVISLDDVEWECFEVRDIYIVPA